MTQKALRSKLASLFTLLITTLASISNAAGLDPTLTDPVVVRQPSNISQSCVPGSQQGIEIDARSYSGEEGVKHQRNGYQFWFENTSAGITHWYEYDDCRIISIFLAHPIGDDPPAPEKAIIPPVVSSVPPVGSGDTSGGGGSSSPSEESEPIDDGCWRYASGVCP